MNILNRHSVALFFTAFCIQSAFAERALNIPEFKAEYNVEKSGFDAIRMKLSLSREAGLWTIKSKSEPTGLVAIFTGNQRVTEQSTFSVDDDDRLVPQEYRYTHKGSDKNRNQHYLFGWQDNRVEIDYRGEKKSLPLEKGTLDTFSAQFALMRDAPKENKTLSYPVISKGNAKIYDYIKLENETLDTELGRLETVKLQRRKNDEDNTIYTSWHAPELHYLPVKVLKEENGKTELAMRLQEVKWLNSDISAK